MQHWEPSSAEEEEAALQQAIKASLGQSSQPQQRPTAHHQHPEPGPSLAPRNSFLPFLNNITAATSSRGSASTPGSPNASSSGSVPAGRRSSSVVPTPSHYPPANYPPPPQSGPSALWPAAVAGPPHRPAGQPARPSVPQRVATAAPSQPLAAPSWQQQQARQQPQQPAHAAPGPRPALPAGSPHLPPSQPRLLHSDPNKCAQCGQGFTFGASLTAMGRRWHSHCFTCELCASPINQNGNAQFAPGKDDGRPYHMACHKLKYNPVCTICTQYIPERNGVIEYKENPFWREKYCPHHQTDGTLSCCSCSRYPQKGEEWVRLADGRELCLRCLDTIVVDTADAQPLYREVMAFYRAMGMNHPEVASFMLVDAHTLDEYSNREGKDASTPGAPIFHVRGLTVAQVTRSIPSIVRAAAGGLSVNSVATPLAQVRCSVSAVLVMYGLPRLLTGSIIAHELMHAWLRMKHITGLSSKVEEGLCQLMAYVWLDQEHGKLQQDPQHQRLASYFTYQIRQDPSETYGDGFREAYEAFQVHGLPAVVHAVSTTGNLPR